jgi:LysR family transcriptional regulator for metE and metH
MNRIAQPKPRLDLRDLELVLALADARSTVGAAARLHVTQSAVSRGLMQAEEKIGARLFDRGGRGLTPTPAGERLIGGAGQVLTQMVELEARAKVPPEAPLRIRLVCECYTAYRWLPSAVARLKREAFSVEIALAIERAGEPVVALREREADIALLTTARVRPPLVEIPLFSDEIVFLVAKGHPLAARKLELRDLTAYPLITSSHTPPPESRWFVGRVFGRTRPAGEQLRFPLTEAIVDAARAGLGIAVLSEWIAGPYLGSGDLVVKRLRGRPLHRPWRMAFRREVGEAARRLAAALVHVAPRMYS